MSEKLRTAARQELVGDLGKGLVWFVTGFFVLNVLALIAAVVVNSFSTRWLGTWLPAGFTGRWYGSAWNEFQLDSVLIVTAEVVLAVVAISLLVGVPAAYTMARRDFPGKRAVLLLFVLPLLVPPMTYGIRWQRFSTSCISRGRLTESSWPTWCRLSRL